MGNHLLDKTERLISNPKRLIALVVIIVIMCVAIYFSWNKLKTLWQKVNTEIALEKDIKEEINNGNPLTYTDNQYKDFANRLYTAMKGSGTDNSTIKDIFKQMNNITDVLKLVQTFGIRDGENLQQWLDGEVHWFEFTNIKKQINAILTEKGIFYKF
jgi:hypothetical protein